MDEHTPAEPLDRTGAQVDSRSGTLTTALPDNGPLDPESLPFVGRWHLLVSTTNWEKGRIIHQWRETLIEAGVATRDYSDQAWARRVGGVTGQHAGRLRRVFQRFADVYESFQGLCWSHFQAALDWGDAEMWLEGAVQNRWSVNQMRHTRWDALGRPADQQPRAEEVIACELDEDFPGAQDTPAGEPLTTSTVTPAYADVQPGPTAEGPDFGDETADVIAFPSATDDPGSAIYTDSLERPTIEFVRPFENIKALPIDLADAFEAFKLAILQHKATGWQEISREDVLTSLDSLKELANAPSQDESPR